MNILKSKTPFLRISKYSLYIRNGKLFSFAVLHFLKQTSHLFIRLNIRKRRWVKYKRPAFCFGINVKYKRSLKKEYLKTLVEEDI